MMGDGISSGALDCSQAFHRIEEIAFHRRNVVPRRCPFPYTSDLGFSQGA